ncbi:hypothetical protein [Streptacidiphilus rugosus]|uniref:hypothetical protein n=1 Tax=Streptacidiphilus rugosus TaxID=405783 RepID=UPI00068A6CFF|nr:hypothetical protein [Streptacidiphilus rugosus]
MTRPTRLQEARAAFGALVVLALATLAGCATGGASASTAAPVPVATPRVTGDLSRLHLPIESYMLTPLMSVQRQWLTQMGIRSCLARFGFAYPDPGPQPTEGSPALAQESLLARRYGVTDPGLVRRWGYHPPRPDSITKGAPGGIVLLAGLPAAEQLVLTGYDPATRGPAAAYQGKALPAQGCRGEADRNLGERTNETTSGGRQRAVNGVDGLVQQLKAASFQASMADPRVVGVFKSRSACMRLAGYHETNPMLAPEMFKPAPDPTAAEISAAKADVACKVRTNLVGVWFAVESEYQNTAIAQHAGDLAGVKAALASQARTIQAQLARTPA